MASDDGAPPRHLGSYPEGLYWSVDAAENDDADEDEPADHSVSGPVIRFMWDYGVRVPLWDAEGLLPEEPGWLQEALGLSERLVDDLRAWGLDMCELDENPRRRTKEAYTAMDVRGRALAERLRQEVGSRYRVRYRPW